MLNVRVQQLALFVGLLLAPSLAVGSPLAAVHVSTQLLQQKDPTAFHPLHLIDGDTASAWCSDGKANAAEQTVQLIFKRPQKIDSIRITPAQVGGTSPRQLNISDGQRAFNFELSDAELELDLDTPMEGELFTLKISTTHSATGVAQGRVPQASTCLAQVELLFRGRPWGGAALPKRLLRHNKHRDKILGRWVGGSLGAPEKFLVFALDGTWSWHYRPILAGRGGKLSGEYRFRGNRLLMRKGEVGRWSDVNLKTRRIAVDPASPGAPLGDYDMLEINSALHAPMADEYNNAQF